MKTNHTVVDQMRSVLTCYPRRIPLRAWPLQAFPKGATAKSIILHIYGESGSDRLRYALRAITKTRTGETPTVHAVGTALRSMRGMWINGRVICGKWNRIGGIVWTIAIDPVKVD